VTAPTLLRNGLEKRVTDIIQRQHNSRCLWNNWIFIQRARTEEAERCRKLFRKEKHHNENSCKAREKLGGGGEVSKEAVRAGKNTAKKVNEDLVIEAETAGKWANVEPSAK